MSQAQKITDHDKIRQWVEKRGGKPGRVKETTDAEGGGLLRIDFGEPEDSIEPIDWPTFFRIFEDRELALLEQEETAEGGTSRFAKFVRR